MRLILSCEHGGNRLPKRFQTLFSKSLLNSHRGIDSGALSLARYLKTKTKAPLYFNTLTRLLIEFNRSLHHPKLFAAPLEESVKQELIEKAYIPYREALKSEIASSKKPLLHLSLHSFTPKLNGNVRDFDIGILYDPKKRSEKHFSLSWQKKLQSRGWKVRLNAPYKGTSDGLTTAFRKEFKEPFYSGIELEVNQRLFKMESEVKKLKRDLAETLLEILNEQ